LQYQTTRFGALDVAPNQIITFPRGIPGFSKLRQFFLVPVPENDCFAWLQSADRPEVAFLVADPFTFYPHYEIRLPVAERELLQVKHQKEVSVHVIVRIPAEGKTEDITANLLAPVVINNELRLGCQLILEESVFSIREPLFGHLSDSCQREEGR
jgi:flagellar assembly factor FliW